MLIVSWTLLVGSTDHKVSFKRMNVTELNHHRVGHGNLCASILSLTGTGTVAMNLLRGDLRTA